MADRGELQLDGYSTGKKGKKSPQKEYELRMIVKYGLGPNTTTKELENFVSNKEREAMALECGLDPTASWQDINDYNKEKTRKAWAVANGLPPTSTDGEIDAHVLEQGRLEEAKKAGLPPDTPWNTITLYLTHKEEERKRMEAQSKKPKKDADTSELLI